MTAPTVLLFSDPHLSGDNSVVVGQHTDARLAACLAHAKAYVPQACHTVFTGDLSDSGGARGYEALRNMLSDWHTPVTCLMGNEDDRDAFGAVFPDVPRPSGFYQSVLSFGAHRLLCLDTLDPNAAPQHSGVLDAPRRAWLEQELKGSEAETTTVLMHHPPAPLGLPFFDEIGLRDPDPIMAAFQAADVALVITGHVHRACRKKAQGTVIKTLPSTGFGLRLGRTEPAISADIKHVPAYGVLHLGTARPRLEIVTLR